MTFVRILQIWVAVALAAILFTLAYIAGSSPTVLMRNAPVSADCAVSATPGHQDAFVLRNGDAAKLWVARAHALQEFVCTDGTLVHVSHYGN